MKKISTILIAIVFILSTELKAQNKRIKVLNIGVFHMGNSSDATVTEYDEKSIKAKQEIEKVTKAISEFKPTIILVEEQPKNQEKLEKSYGDYLLNKKMKTVYSNSETQLLAFEIGKLCAVKRIYGIDHKLAYNYNMMPLATEIKAKKFFKMLKELNKLKNSVVSEPKKIGLKKMLKLLNSDEAYDFLINVNADMLTYVNSENNFEGADEAANFYKRNLRMFANINKVKMNNEDRVLIISGGTHAAFFNMFMKRSLVYKLEPLSDYLK